MKIAVILLALLPIVTPAQDTTPLVRSSTRVVLLDVVVSDKSGKPLRTLGQNDFTVLEDGKPQKVLSFEPPISTESSVLPNSPRTIILLDELNAGYADLAYARDRILLFLKQNHLDRTPTALMTLTTHGVSPVQDYTQDAALLKDRLTQYRPAMVNPVDGETRQEKIQQHAQISINSLVDIARASLGSPYNLNVIWVTSGFAGELRETKSADGAKNGLRRLANLLMSARVRLYSIDPGGTKPLGVTVVATPGSDTPMSSSNILTSSATNEDFAAHGTAYEANQWLAILTGMTGGQAYYGRNDVEVALSQAVDDGAADYLISYSPSNSEFTGEYRKIEIRTNVAGATPRARLGYYAVPDEAAPSQEMRESRWTAALSSPLNYAAFALSCPLTYDAATGKATGTLTIKPTPLTVGTEPQLRQVIRIAGVSNSGAILANWSYQIDWKKAWTNRVTTASFDKVLPKKTTSVRFLVSDPTSQYIGTCNYALR